MCAGTRFGDPGGWLPRDSVEKSQKGPAAAEGVRRAGGRGAERAPGAVTCGCAAGRRRGAGPRRPARPRLGASPASGAFSGGEGDGSGAGSRCQRLRRAAVLRVFLTRSAPWGCRAPELTRLPPSCPSSRFWKVHQRPRCALPAADGVPGGPAVPARPSLPRGRRRPQLCGLLPRALQGFPRPPGAARAPERRQEAAPAPEPPAGPAGGQDPAGV